MDSRACRAKLKILHADVACGSGSGDRTHGGGLCTLHTWSMPRVRYLIVRLPCRKFLRSSGPSRCEGAGAMLRGWSHTQRERAVWHGCVTGDCIFVPWHLRSALRPTAARRAVANSSATHDPSFCNYPVTHARPGCRASFHSHSHVQRFESRYSANGCLNEC